MMGQKHSEGKLFYQFSLDERVPQGHLLRQITEVADLSFVRRMTARFYSHTGQPSIDPMVIFKMALLGYLYGITSERRLVQEIGLNLAYLWFIGYDLDESVPDHSVLSKARRRFGLTVYQGFFKEIVQQCERAGLVQGNKLYADSTLVQANANADSVGSRALVSQLPDIGDHVARLWSDNSESVGPCLNAPPGAEYVGSVVCSPDTTNPSEIPESSDQVSSSLAASPMAASPTLHIADKADMPNKVEGLLNERLVSRIDPEAELVKRARVVAGLYYKVHATVDGARARIVTAVEVTGGGIADEHLLERLIREHEGNVGRRPKEVGADTKYGTAQNYQMLERLRILGSIPMRASSTAGRAVPSQEFTYDPKTDCFVCPNGQRLPRQGLTTQTAAQPLIIYRAKERQCASCSRKEECCGQAKARSVSRPDDGGLRDRVAAYLKSFQARQTIRRRKAWIETIFGDAKERRGLRRAKCRGLDKMRIQAWMVGIAQNVRQLAISKRTRPGVGVSGLEKEYSIDPLIPSFPCPARITPILTIT